MTESRKSTKERSISEHADDDSEFDEDLDTSHPGKPGRKKNPNSQAARRDQNRIAQREFRLRKAQRIRDLEARVEILSGNKDDALADMGNVLKDLMQENQTLRNLLKQLTAFIGEGAGGLLPKLGWDMADFENFITKGETDTAHESYERRKKVLGGGDRGQKRPPDSNGNLGESQTKRARNDSQGDAGSSSYPMLVNMDGMASGTFGNNRSGTENTMFNDLMGQNAATASPMFLQPSPPSNSYGTAGYNNMSGLDMNSPMSLLGGGPTSASPANSGSNHASPEIVENEDPAHIEAQKLINYHLDNYKRNNAYCLPASLRPTLIQRTVPHESIVDRILHPDIRDRMILLRGRFDLIACLMEYRQEAKIHGDDVLSHSNWELSERWLRKYGYLVETPTLSIMNRWRRERNESELQMSELAPAEATLLPPKAPS